MMNKMLSLLGTGHSWTIFELAMKLNVSVDRVRAEIEFLEKNEYIKKVYLNSCDKQCENCHACEGINMLSNQPFVWEIIK